MSKASEYYNGLLNYDALSSEDKNNFLATRGLQNRSYNDIVRIYKNSKFKEAFGDDPMYDQYKAMPAAQRDQMLQYEFARQASEKYFTPEKVGAEKYNMISGLTPQGLVDLVNSDWDPDNYIDMPDITTMTAAGAGIGGTIGGILGAGGGGVGAIPGAGAGAWLGTKIGLGVGMAGAAIESFWNNDTDSQFSNIVAQDNKRKEEMSSQILPQVSALLGNVLDGSVNQDENIRNQSMPVIQALQAYGVDLSKGDATDVDTLFDKVIGKNSPYWNAFKDREELSDITRGDKLNMVAKTLATDLTFQDGGYSSSSINNQNIQNHISENQSWGDWAYNTGKNVIVGAIGALGETVAGTAALGAYVADETNSLFGNKTNYTRNILEGTTENGDEMPLLLNLSYWDGVDKFNTFDGDIIKQARENGGISPYNNVSLAGEEGRFFSWESLNEAVKMSKYALATRATSAILGGATSQLSKATQKTFSKLGASAATSETAATFVNKFGSMGTYLAAGVPVSAGYGLGAYEDTKQRLNQVEDERQANALYDAYIQTPEYEQRLQEVQDQLLNSQRGDNVGGMSLYTPEAARERAEEIVRVEAKSQYLDYVKNHRDEAEANYPSFKENRDNIERIAVDAYALDASLEGAKNTFVNLNFRTYLFNKGTTEMVKGAESLYTPVKYNPKTGLIEQVSKIPGKTIASNKWVDMANATGNQLWGGFFSNYTDDITTGFVTAGAEKRYDNYLDQKYNDKAVNSASDYFLNLYSVAQASLQGAEAAAVDPQSWYDGFIGALGSVAPGSGGFPSLSPYDTRSKKEQEQRGWLSKTAERLARTTGVGATAYDTYYKNILTGEEVKVVNDLLKKRGGDILDLLDFASATNSAELSDKAGSLRDSKTQKDRAFLTTMLYLDRNKNNPVVQAAPQLQESLKTLEAIRRDNIGEEELSSLAQQFLGQSQNRDIASLPEEEAMQVATDRVSHNIEKVRSMVNSMDEAIAEVRKANKNASQDVVDYMATLKTMANLYDKRVEDMEETLGLERGSSATNPINTNSVIARFPTRREAVNALNGLQQSQAKLQEQWDSNVEKIHDLEDNTTRRNKKKVTESKQRLQNNIDIINRLMESNADEIAAIDLALRSDMYGEDGNATKVLSKEDILNLDAESRATLFNHDRTKQTYSANQLGVVDGIVQEYANNGVPNAGQMFADIYALNNSSNTNKEVYADNINHPELAEEYALRRQGAFLQKLNLLQQESQANTEEWNQVDNVAQHAIDNGVIEEDDQPALSTLAATVAYLKRNNVGDIASQEAMDLLTAVNENGEVAFEKYLGEVATTPGNENMTILSTEEAIQLFKDVMGSYNKEQQELADNAAPIVPETTTTQEQSAPIEAPEPVQAPQRSGVFAQEGATFSTPEGDLARELAANEEANPTATPTVEQTTQPVTVPETTKPVNPTIEAYRDNSNDDVASAAEVALNTLDNTPRIADEVRNEAKQKLEDLSKNTFDTREEFTDAVNKMATQLELNSEDGASDVANLLRQAAAKAVKAQADTKTALNDGTRDYTPILPRRRRIDTSTQKLNDTYNMFPQITGPNMTTGPAFIASMDADIVRRKYPDAANARYYDDNNIDGFLRDGKLDPKSDILFITDEGLTKGVMQDMGDKYDANVALPIVAVVEDANGPVEIDGKHYQPLSIMAATGKEGSVGSGHMSRIRNLALGNQGTQLVKNADGSPIVTKLYGKPIAYSADIRYRGRNSAVEVGIEDLPQSERLDLQAQTKPERRKSKAYKKAKKDFLKRLRTKEKDGRTVLYFEQPTLKGNFNHIEVFVDPINESLAKDSDQTLEEVIATNNPDALINFNSRTSRAAKAFGTFTNSLATEEMIFDTDASGQYTPATKKLLDKLASSLEGKVTNFINVPMKSGWGYEVSPTESIVGENRVMSIDLVNSNTGEQIHLTDVHAGMDEGSLKTAQAEFLKNLMTDNGTVRMIDNENSFAKWNVPYTDAVSNAEAAENNMSDIYDDDILGVPATTFNYKFRGIAVNNPFRADGTPVYTQTANAVNAMPTTPINEPVVAAENQVKSGDAFVDSETGAVLEGTVETPKNPAQQNAERIVERITTDSKEIVLADDGSGYVNKKTGQKFARVTSIISADQEAGERFDPNSPWAMPSSNIGTGVDEFVRDFFAGKVKPTAENLEKLYPNATKDQLQKFAEQLQVLNNSLSASGLTVVPRDVTVTGSLDVADSNGNIHTIDIAGTLDLLAYDARGNFYIFDMKTYRSDIQSKHDKYARQMSMYKKLLENKYGVKVASMQIIPIKVSYPAPSRNTAYSESTTQSNQLMVNGKEFKDAKPSLNMDGMTTALNYREPHIIWDKLTDAEREMFSGIKEELEAQTSTEITPVEAAVSEEVGVDAMDSTLGVSFDDSYLGDFFDDPDLATSDFSIDFNDRLSPIPSHLQWENLTSQQRDALESLGLNETTWSQLEDAEMEHKLGCL